MMWIQERAQQIASWIRLLKGGHWTEIGSVLVGFRVIKKKKGYWTVQLFKNQMAHPIYQSNQWFRQFAIGSMAKQSKRRNQTRKAIGQRLDLLDWLVRSDFQNIENNSNPTPSNTFAQQGNLLMSLSVHSRNKTLWIIDSKATNHMTNLSNLFSSYIPCSSCQKVRMVDSSLSSFAGKGFHS